MATKASFAITWRRPESTPEEQRHSSLVRAAEESAPVPEFLPAHRGFLIDRTGQLWLQEYPLERAFGPPPRCFVFDSAGVLRHSVRLPFSGMSFWGMLSGRQDEIGADYVLSVQQDADGVQSVVHYPLRKGKP